MDEAIRLADEATQHVLLKGALADLETFTGHHTPHARGVYNAGFVIPRDIEIPSSRMREYLSTLSFSNMNGVNLWLQIMNKIREKNSMALVDGSLTMEALRSELVQLGLARVEMLSLPFIQLRGMSFGDYDLPQFHSVSYIEYFNARCLTTTDLFYEIVQIALFGLPINADFILALRIEDFVLDYVKSRLFQGSYDNHKVNGLLDEGVYSSMYPSVSMSNDPALLENYITGFVDEPTPERKQMRLNELTQELNRGVQFLGSTTPYLQALAEKNVFSSSLDENYLRYLKKKGVMPKIGPALYNNIFNQRTVGDTGFYSSRGGSLY
jgi:hypothetical protein